MKRWAVALAIMSTLIAGCGGGGGSGGETRDQLSSEVVTTACLPSGDDSTKVDASLFGGTRETDFVFSHTVGTPVFGTLITRQRQDGTPVTMDYMVHTPSGTPTAMVLLVAGGSLTAGIRGTGATVTDSGGNFLVRSAHRFMQAGYVVVTVDRPSDYVDYGDIDVPGNSYLYDDYRNSVSHAVDLAAVIAEQNTGQWPVFISGTSRGAVSAAANNTLAAGIALSSPVTRSSRGGSPVGSSTLPTSVIERPTHVLWHRDDTCTATLPTNSEALLLDLDTNGVDASGNAVTGGFRDTVRNDVCGAFDYHGFTGIENCAVSLEAAWMDGRVTAWGANTSPTARNGSYVGMTRIDLSTLASDANGDALAYSLPFNETVLGGSVTVDADGIASYTAPPGLPSGVEDSFAYVVSDGIGGVATAVVRITIL